VTNAHANLNADVYNISDDASYPDQSTRVTPTVGVTLRYPLAGRSKGAAHLVEPVIALAWSDAYGDIPPNEDSVLPELDQASLFAADRLPGEDVSETGLRTALGVNWTRKGDAGVNSTLTFGRVFRENQPAISGRSRTQTLAAIQMYRNGHWIRTCASMTHGLQALTRNTTRSKTAPRKRALDCNGKTNVWWSTFRSRAALPLQIR